MKVFLVSLVFLYSCGSTDENKPPIIGNGNDDSGPSKIYINPDFVNYYADFKSKIGPDPFEISIDYATLQEPDVGLCWSFSNSKANYIQIDEDFWATASENERQNIIFHELGHCLLHLEHDEATHTIGSTKVPNSLMFPIIFGDFWYYEKFKEDYFYELKNKSSSLTKKLR